jgi:hypothetical protein
MVRVDALSHAAKVVELEAFGDCTAVVLVAPAVRIDLLTLVLERAVPAWVKRANPLPAASCLVDDNVLLKADFPRRCRATALSWFWLDFFHVGIIPQGRGFARTYF